ncbi:MAG: type II toxin-antitoxin system RelE/ParE family toxin [Gammaproteobacteria bacterium]|nr:type II toxin-antitoxin system RelE/ParE family toxin [Gammaproteobacteria bacterium]
MGRSHEEDSGPVGLIPVEIRPAAAADIEEAALWYDSQRPGLGSEFLEELDYARQSIVEAPQRFPVVKRDTRRALLRRFPYALYYRIYPDRILVVACMHGRRHPKRWQRRK